MDNLGIKKDAIIFLRSFAPSLGLLDSQTDPAGIGYNVRHENDGERATYDSDLAQRADRKLRRYALT